MRVLNGRESPTDADKVLVLMCRYVEVLRVGLHAQIGRLDVLMQSSRRNLAAMVIEGTQRERVSDRCR